MSSGQQTERRRPTLAVRAADQAVRRADRAGPGQLRALAAGELVAIIGPNGAGKTTLLSILAGVLDASEGEIAGARTVRGRLGAAAAGALLEAVGGREPAPVRAARAAARIPRQSVARMLAQTALADRAGRRGRAAVGRQPAARQHRDRPARASRPCCCSTSRRRRSIRASASGCGSSSSSSRARHQRRVLDAQRRSRPSATPTACSCSVDGELLFTGTPRASCSNGSPSRPAAGLGDARLRVRVRALPARARPLSSVDALAARQGRSRSCKRSPLLVALLVVYPIAIALMIGFALSSPPGKPKVAFYNEVAAGPRPDPLRLPADQRRPATPRSCSSRSSRSCVRSRAEAIEKVRDGQALGGA